MSLHVALKSATNLPKLGIRKVDPYCELTFHEEKQRSTKVSNSQNPAWNESFKWTLEVAPESTETIEVVILDYETLQKDRPIVNVSVPLGDVLKQGSTSLDVAAVSSEGKSLDTSCQLHVDLTYRAPVSESLRLTIVEKDSDLSELKEHIETLKTVAAEKGRALSEANVEIDRLKEAIEHLRKTAAEREAQLSKAAKQGATTETEQPVPATGKSSAQDETVLRSQNEALTREVASLKQRIEELENQPGNRAGGSPRQARKCCTCCGLL